MLKITVSIGAIAILAVLGFLNLARFSDIESEHEGALHIIEKYVSRGVDTQFSCSASLDEGFPQRWPRKPSDLLGKQVVWNFSWKCVAPDEIVEGYYAVFADGNTVWSGRSDKRGNLGTEEF